MRVIKVTGWMWTVLAVAVAMAGAGCRERNAAKPLETVEGSASVADRYAESCGTCHGPEGEGSHSKAAPAIAGLPDYYVVGELKKFQNRTRGVEPDAPEDGNKMHEIAISMDLKSMQEMGAYLAAMRPVVSELTVAVGADFGRGRKLYEAQCAECHGMEAEGDPAKMSPPLFVFQDWYIEAQLEKFHIGMRKGDPANEASQRMHATAVQLVFQEDRRDLAGFIKSRLTGQSDASP